MLPLQRSDILFTQIKEIIPNRQVFITNIFLLNAHIFVHAIRVSVGFKGNIQRSDILLKSKR